jgi:tRNA-2-methylthio-N6-dimethylallyladenosine synthase
VTYFFETYGCQMNIAESAAMEQVFAGRGWQKAASAEDASLVLLNTCSVRETAETRLRGRLAQYQAASKNRHLTLIVAGCMASRLGEKLKEEYPAVGYVMGALDRSRLPEILEEIECKHGLHELSGLHELNKKKNPCESVQSVESVDYKFSPSHLEPGAFRSFLPIMHGCHNFCSYCIVPYVRGREVSRSPQSIRAEIDALAAAGVREITLLGQNVNSYSFGGQGTGDKGDIITFPALLQQIAGWIHGTSIEWVRFLSANPKDFSDKTIEVMAANPCFCRHIHLPVQHGSNRMLAAMNRRYTREAYLGLAGRLRSALPGLSLSTDIMVGFPGETEEDMAELLGLMDSVKYSYAYMYHYNVREGTAAAKLGGRIPYGVKIERLSRVIARQKEHRLELLKAKIGGREKVLVEGRSRKNADEFIARTEGDDAVVLVSPDAKTGEFVTARLESLKGTTFRAKTEE